MRKTFVNNRYNFLYIIVLIFYSHFVYSSNIKEKDLSSYDKNATIYINSEFLTLNQNNKTAEFEGNVVICFDDTEVRTRKITIIYKENSQSEKKDIDTILIPGKIKAIRNKGNVIVNADKGIYEGKNFRLILKGNVIIQNGRDILKTNVLTYYTKIIK